MSHVQECVSPLINRKDSNQPTCARPAWKAFGFTNHLWIACCQVISGIVALMLLVTSSAFSQAVTPVKIALTPVFDLNAINLPRFAIRDMRAGAEGLYFITDIGLSPKMNVNLTVTSLAGEEKFTLHFGNSEVIDWHVSETGTIAVALEAFSPDASPELRFYDRTGAPLRSESYPREEYLAAHSAGHAVRVTRSGILSRRDGRLMADVAARIGMEHAGPALYTVDLPGDQVALVDGVNATITVVDLAVGRTFSGAITHGEVARVAALNSDAPPGLTGLTVHAATADNSGRVLCMLSRFRPEQGAPVLSP